MEAFTQELAHNGKENEKGEKKSKSRFMHKLFKEKDKKTPAVENEDSVNDFLHGPADKLHMMPPTSPGFPPPPSSAFHPPPNPPPLTRIDTSSARRWPTAAQINSVQVPRRRSASPKRSRKGLVVRFTNDKPEIIGEGGDEATSPVAEIGVRLRAHTHPQVHQQSQHPPNHAQAPLDFGFHNNESPVHISTPKPPVSDDFDFQRGPLRRTATGFQSVSDQNHSTDSVVSSQRQSPATSSSNLSTTKNDSYDPTSFAARVRAEMRSGEGKALVAAVTGSPTNYLQSGSFEEDDAELSPQLKELRINTIRNSYISTSGSSLPASLHIGGGTSQASQRSTTMTESPVAISRTSTLQSAARAVADDALEDFSNRISHLFTLFRLATESVKPVSQCSTEELVRIALWWFLKGRMNLEATVRDRPMTPENQRRRLHALQQAHADLGKALWIAETVTSQRPEIIDHYGAKTADPNLTNILESRQGILSSLRKLTMSMKRNGFLPPDSNDAPLPQGLDNTIWTPQEGNKSLVASQRPTLHLSLTDAFPLGDSNRYFHFARMFVDGVLDEAAAHQYYRCPLLVSLVRGQQDKEISAIITSQDGGLKLCISADSSRGPTWEDVSWQQKSNAIKVELPRGFTLRINCSEPDFRTIWTTYDYQAKIHASLVQRRNEELVYETVLKSFQFIDSNPESRLPKEPLPNCFFRLFEKTHIEKGAAGARTMHRGFRIAMNTHPKTKTVRGIDETLPPNLPIQFGFLRGDNSQPAMLLKIATPKSNYKMIMTFDDPGQRARLHQLLTGTALGHAQDVVAEAPMKAFSLAGVSIEGLKDLNCMKTLDWKGFRVVNEDEGDLENNKTILSEHLRVALDFKTGSLTDRINVGTGELKIRLDLKSSKQLQVFREPQEDITLSVVESQVSHELPYELADLLDTAAKTSTIRTYLFPGIQDLHVFQAAITGFVVQYDGLAASFNIARRRMVVPIYKKWDAMSTRLQVVKREKVVQLLAFFEGFSHGDCMSFPLKSTDIFEVSGKGGKWTVRIVDCKFAMPKANKADEISDHAFVCLDVPEYPGEHDDITLVFETESERDKFTATLPAPVKLASRMGSVRR